MSITDPAAAPRTLYCSFCRKSQHEVAQLISGPGVFICDACTKLCGKIVAAEKKKSGNQPVGPTPEFTGFNTYPTDKLLGLLAPVEATFEDVGIQLRNFIDLLREREVSWTDIGAALGVSRQAAWRRFN